MTARATERLRQFLGDWEFSIEGEMADGRRLRGKGTAKGEIVPGGGVMVALRGDIEGEGHFEETNLLGYSEDEEKVHLFTVNSWGSVHDHEGVWETEDRLYVEWRGVAADTPMLEKVRFEWKGDELTVYSTDVTAGKVQDTFVYRFSRTGPMEEGEPIAVPS